MNHPSLPPREKYLLHLGSVSDLGRKRALDDEDSLESDRSCPSQKRRRIQSVNLELDQSGNPPLAIEYLPDIEMYPPDIRLEDIPKLCVLRPCPLVCVNQDIVSFKRKLPMGHRGMYLTHIRWTS